MVAVVEKTVEEVTKKKGRTIKPSTALRLGGPRVRDDQYTFLEGEPGDLVGCAVGAMFVGAGGDIERYTKQYDFRYFMGFLHERFGEYDTLPDDAPGWGGMSVVSAVNSMHLSGDSRQTIAAFLKKQGR